MRMLKSSFLDSSFWRRFFTVSNIFKETSHFVLMISSHILTSWNQQTFLKLFNSIPFFIHFKWKYFCLISKFRYIAQKDTKSIAEEPKYQSSGFTFVLETLSFLFTTLWFAFACALALAKQLLRWQWLLIFLEKNLNDSNHGPFVGIT